MTSSMATNTAAVDAAASVALPLSPQADRNPFVSAGETVQSTTTTAQPLTSFPPPPTGSPDSSSYATPVDSSSPAAATTSLPQSSRLPAATGLAPQPQPNDVQQPPPSTAAAPPVPPVLPREREHVADTRITSLQAMFPDIDSETLSLVLESVNGDEGRAIDALLGMSDPDYVSPEQEPVTQSDLDERYARQLMLEDEQEAGLYAQHQQQQSLQPVNFQGGHEAPAWRPDGRQHHAQGGPSAGPNMAEIQEQIGKFAETGKKTFTSLLGKVKAKMNEYDQSRQEPAGTTPQWGQSSSDQPYYDPNAPRRTSESRAPAEYRPTQAPHSYTAAAPVVAPTPSSGPTPASQIIDQYRGGSSNPSTTARATSPFDSSGATTPRPPSTGAGMSGAPIDAGKLGLLPKRPVSLLRPSSPGTQPPAQGITQAQPVAAAAVPPPNHRQQSEELEYAENPFEDSRR